LATGRLWMRSDATETGANGNGLTWGPFRLNPDSHEVWAHGSLLELTFTEFRLLALLLWAQGRVVTREEILREVWGPGQTGRALDVHIRRLRGKLEHAGPASLVTIRKVGYRLTER